MGTYRQDEARYEAAVNTAEHQHELLERFQTRSATCTNCAQTFDGDVVNADVTRYEADRYAYEATVTWECPRCEEAQHTYFADEVDFEGMAGR